MSAEFLLVVDLEIWPSRQEGQCEPGESKVSPGIVLLSLKKPGSPDELDLEIIGEKQ